MKYLFLLLSCCVITHTIRADSTHKNKQTSLWEQMRIDYTIPLIGQFFFYDRPFQSDGGRFGFGGQVEIKYRVQPRLSIGLLLKLGIERFGNALNGKGILYNSSQTNTGIPMEVKGSQGEMFGVMALTTDYYFSDKKRWRPFIGVGAGMQYSFFISDVRQNTSEFPDQEELSNLIFAADTKEYDDFYFKNNHPDYRKLHLHLLGRIGFEIKRFRLAISYHFLPQVRKFQFRTLVFGKDVQRILGEKEGRFVLNERKLNHIGIDLILFIGKY